MAIICTANVSNLYLVFVTHPDLRCTPDTNRFSHPAEAFHIKPSNVS